MYYFRGNPKAVTSIPNFIKMRSAVLMLNHADRPRDRYGHPYMSTLHEHRSEEEREMGRIYEEQIQREN
jgi:hypothetical protein